MINWIGFRTLVFREITRFFTVYRQTVIPGLISSGLYIIIFGLTLQRRISSIDGVPYTVYILPGLIMMNVITNAYNNTASSMLQMKLLQQIQDMLITPLSNVELALAFIIGGAVRGFVNGILVMFLGIFIVGMPLENPLAVILIIFMVSWAFSSIGLVIGITAQTWDNIATMVNFFITPLIFLGGVFYSINYAPRLLENHLTGQSYLLCHQRPEAICSWCRRYTFLNLADSINFYDVALFFNRYLPVPQRVPHQELGCFRRCGAQSISLSLFSPRQSFHRSRW